MTILTTVTMVKTNDIPNNTPIAIKCEILPCLKSRSRLALLWTPIKAARVLNNRCQKLIVILPSFVTVVSFKLLFRWAKSRLMSLCRLLAKVDIGALSKRR